MNLPMPPSGGFARHIPNLLTALRLLVTPLVFWWLLQHQYRLAGVLAAAALATDLLDGYLARRFDWQSQLGGWLDPLADKLLMAACFIGLAMAGAVPIWLMLLVLLRDGVIIGGATAYRLLIAKVRAEPSLLGKACTAVQSIYVLGLLLDLALDRQSSPWSDWAVWGVAAMVLASGIDYVWRWTQRARRRTGSSGDE